MREEILDPTQLKSIRLLTSKFKGPPPVGGQEYQRINNSLVVCHIPQHFGEEKSKKQEES